MRFTLNGKTVDIRAHPMKRLLDVVRDDCGLTGTKEGCGEGECGACTVLLDGEPVKSCLMLAADAEGHEITTVEGLGTPESLSPLQQAFVEADAMQCGFCTPGFVVAATAFLGKHPNPSLQEIQHGLAGNLCRCGTYGRIRRAIHTASAKGGKES